MKLAFDEPTLFSNTQEIVQRLSVWKLVVVLCVFEYVALE